jgi:maltose-binding protein MalE
MPNIPEMGSVWGAGGDNILALRNGEVGAEEAMTNAASQVEELLAG